MLGKRLTDKSYGRIGATEVNFSFPFSKGKTIGLEFTLQLP